MIAILLMGCGPSKEEVRNADMLAFKMPLLFMRTNLRLMVGKDRKAEEEEGADYKAIDDMIATRNSRGWSLCREEIVEMRAILERARSGDSSRGDEVRMKELESRVKSKTIGLSR